MARILPEGRWALAAATATWVGAILGMGNVPPAHVAVAVGVVLVVWRHTRIVLLGALVVAGVVSGAAAASRIQATLTTHLEPGPVDATAVVAADPVPERDGWRTLVRLGEPTSPGGSVVVQVETRDRPLVAVGDVVSLSGDLRDRSGRLRGDPYAATIGGAAVTLLARAHTPALALGNGLRGFVVGRLEPHLPEPAAALLAGFLVGDTTRLDDNHLDALRSSGLTHYVAVSGSNVALFLGAWWLVSGPVPIGPRTRAAGGLVALVVFVVATRWEPSVVRAATMAAMVLTGRILGFPVSVWRALGAAVTVLLLVSGDLATDVGFQLSVGATAGVVVAARISVVRRPVWLWRSLAVAAAAQLAVMPVLLATFGTVPLLSPVANLIAAPLVSTATVVGAAGLAVGSDAVISIGLVAADAVLLVATRVAGWPQLDVVGALVVVSGFAALRSVRLRPAVIVAGVVWLVVAAWPVARSPWPELIFLDVGQGDALLLRDPVGGAVLVDGGADPLVLRSALRRHGVHRLELMVVTHGDADHVGGLQDIFDHAAVAEVWFPDLQPQSGLLAELLDAAAARGVPVTGVRAGIRVTLGATHLQVLSPARRFAAENDGSVVLLVTAGAATALLTGDIESVAQAELPPLNPSVLHVPHHGSATTDLRWLEATVGEVAVISVGPNTFGHPTQVVLDTLAEAGTRVYTTQLDGDVTIPLCSPCGPVG